MSEVAKTLVALHGEDEVICISSDSEDDVVAVLTTNCFEKQNYVKKSDSFLSERTSIQAINHHRVGISTSKNTGIKSELKHEAYVPREEIMLDDDDDEYEIEYAGDSGSGRGHDVRKQALPENEIQEVNVNGNGHTIVEGTLNQVVDVNGEISGKSHSDKTTVNSGSLPEPVAGPSSSCSKSVLEDEFITQTKETLNIFIDELKTRCKRNQLEKISKKIWKSFNDVKSLKKTVHIRLQEEITYATKAVINCPAKLFSTVRHLLDLLRPDSAANLQQATEEDRLQLREENKKKMIQKYEKVLAKIERKISKLQKAEVDWECEDDHNSPYILMEKYKSRFMTAYYKLCDILQSDRFTDRPTQKRINLKKCGASCGYGEIDGEVEKFVNRRGYQFIPDFTDIESLVKKVNITNGLGLIPDTSSAIAKEMFTKIIKIIKKRRGQDFRVSMIDISNDGLNDPADDDEELRRKLAENEKLKKSESAVIEHYAKLAAQEETEETQTQNDDADGSPVVSENEEEDDGDNDPEDGMDRAVLEAPLHDELTEDAEEDENALDTENGFELLDENVEVALIVPNSRTGNSSVAEPVTVKPRENDLVEQPPTAAHATKSNSNQSDASSIDEPPTKRMCLELADPLRVPDTTLSS